MFNLPEPTEVRMIGKKELVQVTASLACYEQGNGSQSKFDLAKFIVLQKIDVGMSQKFVVVTLQSFRFLIST